MPRTPKGIIRKRRTAWQVDFPTLIPRYRKSWPTEAQAIRDLHRKERQIGGVGISDEQIRSVESALHRLATTQGPCQGKSLDFVVDYFFENFQGEPQSLTLNAYGLDYKLRKEEKLEAKSYTEVRLHVDDFLKEFGEMKPEDVKAVQLERYLASKTSRFYRDKSLRAFFGWLAGRRGKNGKKKATPLENPPLKEDPFAFVTSVEYEKQNPTEVLTGPEITVLLREAKALGILPWVTWLLFTGMRPDSEARPFWSEPGHGWTQVFLDRSLICVTDDLEKCGARCRDITIPPNFRSWLEWMRVSGQQPVYSRRKMRTLFARVIPSKRHQDILRHTWISYSLKRRKESEISYEGATSSKMIAKHYRRQVPDAEAAAFFDVTPRTLGLV